MKTYLKLELKRSILSIRTLISIFILVIPFAISSLNEFKYICNYVDGLDYFIIIYNHYYHSFIVPIVCVIYSVTVIKDLRSGFLDKLLEIIDIKSYIKGKLLANAIVNTVIMMISYGVFVIFFVALFGIRNTEAGGINSGLYLIDAFSGIYSYNKLAYFIMITLMFILSVITFSSFVLVIAMMVNKVYVPYLFTLFFIIMTAIVTNMYGINYIIDFNIVKQFEIVTTGNSTIRLITYDLCLVIISYLLVHIYLKNYNHKNAVINFVKGEN